MKTAALDVAVDLSNAINKHCPICVNSVSFSQAPRPADEFNKLSGKYILSFHIQVAVGND